MRGGKINKKILDALIKYKSIIIILFLGVIFVIFFSKIVPFNMDEFNHYHPISCHHYQNNALNEFHESCGQYDLNFFNTGLILPLRSFPYTGSFPALLYYPLFLIWKSPLSARFLGIIFLLIQSLVLSKIFKIKYEYIFVGLVAFFPYFFQHLVDTGPVKFQLTSIFIIYYLLKRWLNELKFIYPVSIAIIIFLGIWTKLTYFWLIPGIIIVSLIEIIQNKKQIFQNKNIRKMLFQILIAAAILLSLLVLLFFSTSPHHSNIVFPYVIQIFSSRSFSLNELFNLNLIKDQGVFKALINPFVATQRIYHPKGTSFFIYLYDFYLYLGTFLLSLLLLIKSNKILKKEAIKPIIFFLCFILTFLMALRSRSAWAMHHTILSFPFLIMSFITSISYLKNNKVFKNKYLTSKNIIIAMSLLFILLNSYFFILFPNQNIYLNQEERKINDFSKNEINEILNNEYLAKNYIYVVIDWGMSYYQALYGNKFQSVVYIDPSNVKKPINDLKKLSIENNRKMLFIHNPGYHLSNIKSFRSSFNLEQCKIIKEESVWKIELETDNNNKNICFK